MNTKAKKYDKIVVVSLFMYEKDYKKLEAKAKGTIHERCPENLARILLTKAIKAK